MTGSRARVALAAALVMGIAGDILLRGDDPGIGLSLWLMVVVFAAIVAHGRPAARERALLLVVLLVAAAGLVLRDDPRLQVFSVMAVLGTGALIAWNSDGRRLARFQIDDSVRATLAAIWAAGTGAPSVLRLGLADASEAGERSARRTRRRDLLVGAFFAIPPLLIAASLLGSADPVLGEWFARWSALVSDETLEHLLLIAVIGWASAGWLRTVATETDPHEPTASPLRAETAFARVAPSLYGLAALLAIYLGLQTRVLFGGAAYLVATSGLTVAEYARAGFFQLVAVTAVVLGVLLVADRILDQSHAEGTGHFRTAGALLLLLVGALILSAFARMGLYVQYFGLSADRLYALAGMLGIALVLGWFGWTVLRGRRSRFGPGLLVVAGGWALLLNVASPESIVVRVNAARAAQGHEFDVPYHRKLSADALPALYAALETLPVASCMALRDALAQDRRAGRFEPRDWQSWSVPRSAGRIGGPASVACESAPGERRGVASHD